MVASNTLFISPVTQIEAADLRPRWVAVAEDSGNPGNPPAGTVPADLTWLNPATGFPGGAMLNETIQIIGDITIDGIPYIHGQLLRAIRDNTTAGDASDWTLFIAADPEGPLVADYTLALADVGPFPVQRADGTIAFTQADTPVSFRDRWWNENPQAGVGGIPDAATMQTIMDTLGYTGPRVSTEPFRDIWYDKTFQDAWGAYQYPRLHDAADEVDQINAGTHVVNPRVGNNPDGAYHTIANDINSVNWPNILGNLAPYAFWRSYAVRAPSLAFDGNPDTAAQLHDISWQTFSIIFTQTAPTYAVSINVGPYRRVDTWPTGTFTWGSYSGSGLVFWDKTTGTYAASVGTIPVSNDYNLTDSNSVRRYYWGVNPGAGPGTGIALNDIGRNYLYELTCYRGLPSQLTSGGGAIPEQTAGRRTIVEVTAALSAQTPMPLTPGLYEMGVNDGSVMPVLTPVDGTLAVIQNGNEFRSSSITEAALQNLLDQKHSLPTVQAGLGAAVQLETVTEPSNIHINSNLGDVTWDVAAETDGKFFYVMSTGTEASTITVANAAGVFRRNGTTNEALAGGVLNIPPATSWLIHLTDNAGNKFVNTTQLGGSARLYNGSLPNIAAIKFIPSTAVDPGAMFTITTLGVETTYVWDSIRNDAADDDNVLLPDDNPSQGRWIKLGGGTSNVTPSGIETGSVAIVDAPTAGASNVPWDTGNIQFTINEPGTFEFTLNMTQAMAVVIAGDSAAVGGALHIGSTAGASDIAILDAGRAAFGYDDDNRGNDQYALNVSSDWIALTPGTYHAFFRTVDPHDFGGSRRPSSVAGTLSWMGHVGIVQVPPATVQTTLQAVASDTDVYSTTVINPLIEQLSDVTGQHIGTFNDRTALLAAANDLRGNPISHGDIATVLADEIGSGNATAPEFPKGRYRVTRLLATDPITWTYEPTTTVTTDRIPTLDMVAGRTVFPAGVAGESGITIKHQVAGAPRRFLWEAADKNGDGSSFVISATFQADEWQRVGIAQVEAEDLNIAYLAGTTSIGTDVKATAQGTTFVDISSGTATFPATPESHDAIQIDDGGTAVFDTGDGNGAISRTIAAGEIYEFTGGSWHRRVSAVLPPQRFKSLFQNYTVGGTSTDATDDISIRSAHGTVSAAFNCAGATGNQILYDLGVQGYSGNIYIKKTTLAIFLTFNWASSAAQVILHPNGEVQKRDGGGTAIITVGGATLNPGAVAIVGGTGHANNLNANSVNNNSEWSIAITATADGGDLSTLSIGFSTFAATGGGTPGLLELAFDVEGLAGLHTGPTRYPVTINGLTYTNDPTGFDTHKGAWDGGPTRYFLPVAVGNEIDLGTLDLTGSTGTPVVTQSPGRWDAIDVTSDGGDVVISLGFKATGDFQVMQTKITPQSGIPNLAVIDHGLISGTSGSVVTISNTPGNELITNVLFFEAGTTTATAGTFQRLASDVIAISDIVADVDIEVITATSEAPELDTKQSTVRWIHTAPGLTTKAATVGDGNGVNYADITTAAEFAQSQTFTANPGKRINIDVDVTGYTAAVGNWPKWVLLAVDDVGTPLTSVVADGQEEFLAEDSGHIVWIRGNNNVSGVRGSVGRAHVSFVVPGSGQYAMRVYPTNGARWNIDHDRPLIHIEESDRVTIAATERVQAAHSLILSGAGVTINADSPGRVTPTEATVHENVANSLILDLPVGQSIATATPINATVSLAESLVPGTGFLTVIPTGANPSVAVTTGPVPSKVETYQYFYGSFDNQAGNTGNGYVWTTQGSSGSAIAINGDNDQFTLAEGFTYKIHYVALQGRSNAQFINVNYRVDGAPVRNFYPVSDDENNWGGGNGFLAILEVPTGGGAKTVDFIRASASGNGNHDARILIEVIAKESVTVLPEIFTGFPVTANGAAPVSGAQGYNGMMLPVEVSLTLGQQIDQASVASTNGSIIGTIVAGDGTDAGDGASRGVIFVRVNGSATDVTFTEKSAAVGATTMQMTGEYDASDLDINTSNVTTGLNFATADYVELSFTDSDAGRKPWPAAWTDVRDWVDTATNETFYIWNFDNSYVNVTNVDVTNGSFTIGDAIRGARLQYVRTWQVGPIGYAVPAASVLLTTRTISVTSPVGTIDGAATALGADNQNNNLRFDLSPNMQIDTAVADNGAVATVTNAITGHIDVKPNGADTKVTITEKQAATYQGRQFVGEYLDGSWNNGIGISNGAHSPQIDTGFDWTQCDSVTLTFRNAQNSWNWTTEIDMAAWTDYSGHWMCHHHDTAYIWMRSSGALNSGIIEGRIFGGGSGYRLIHVIGERRAENGFIVPVGTIATTPVTLSARSNTVAKLIDGSTTKIVRELIGQEVILELATGEALVNPMTIDIPGATVEIVNRTTGRVWVEVPVASPGAGVIDYSTTNVSNQYRTLVATATGLNSGGAVPLLAGRTMADLALEFPGGFLMVVVNEGDSSNRIAAPLIVPIDQWVDDNYVELSGWGFASEFFRLNATTATATSWTTNQSSFAGSTCRVYALTAELALPPGYVTPARHTITAQNDTGGALVSRINGNLTGDFLQGIPAIARLTMNPGHYLASVTGAGAIIDNPRLGTVQLLTGAVDEVLAYTTAPLPAVPNIVPHVYEFTLPNAENTADHYSVPDYATMSGAGYEVGSYNIIVDLDGSNFLIEGAAYIGSNDPNQGFRSTLSGTGSLSIWQCGTGVRGDTARVKIDWILASDIQ